MRNILVLMGWLISCLAGATEYGDVVFSELMVDPEPAVGLPAVEYVEICNRSSSSVSLAGWSLWCGEKPYSLPACTLSPGEYLVLCAKAALSMPAGFSAFGMSSFPTLVNTGRLMALVSSSGVLVCSLEYSDRWYGSGFKSNGGWSLECKDLSNLSGAASNWTASVDPSGGTPGRKNSISMAFPSNTRPSCARLFVPSPKTIELHFSEFMNPSTISNSLNYSLSPETSMVSSITVSFPDLRVVTLQLSDTLVSEQVYALALSGMMDVSGVAMADTVLQLGLPETPEKGSLQFNEILFNPQSGGRDYIEVVNVGTRCADLSQVWLTNRSSNNALNAGQRLSEKPLPCLPGSYWLLSESPDSVCSIGGFPLMLNALKIAPFPSLPDDVGNAVLVTSSAVVLDEMSYDPTMHFGLISDPEGVALEKIRPDAPSSIRENWLSATSSSHYGTPGFKNSQYREQSIKGVQGFYTKEAWMTPNNDGSNDRVQIQYELPEACVGSLYVFDLCGRLVRKLVNNELLGVLGSYSWDGLAGDGSLSPCGRYILIAEAFAPSGRVIRNRLVLTILL